MENKPSIENNFNIFSCLTTKKNTFYLSIDSTVRQALEKMDFHRYSVIPLLSKKGEYLTTISEGDLLRFLKNNAGFDIKKAEDTFVNDIEKYRPYRSIKNDASLEEIIELIINQNFIPVVDDRNIFIGIIKRSSIIKFLSTNI